MDDGQEHGTADSARGSSAHGRGSPTRGDVGRRVHEAAERLRTRSRRPRGDAPRGRQPADATVVEAPGAEGWSTGTYESGTGHRYVYRCPVHWGDLDAFGHVNNVRMLRYLEDARVAMLFVDAVREGVPGMSHLIVARHEVDYLYPLEFRAEPIRIEVWVRQIRAASFTVGYEVRDDDHLFVHASSLIVPYDFDGARPRRLASAERTFLERYLERQP
ncbi:MAG: acyl-CoA thioesterase [Streptosporangiaceae bacterium]